MPSRKVKSTGRQWLIRTDANLRRELVIEVSAIVNEMYQYHRDVVARWEHKVRFQTQVSVQPTLISGTIIPTGRNAEIWTFVDAGTKGPYPIPTFANPAVTLKFRTAYSARTAPIAKFNVGSGRAVGPWRSAKQVQHPGIEAREFSKKSIEDMTPPFRRRIENVFRRVSRQ